MLDSAIRAAYRAVLMMTRSKRLRAFCAGRLKRDVAERHLKIAPQFLSYLLKERNLDRLIARIDALPVETKERT